MQTIDRTYHLPAFPAFPAVSRYVALGSVEEAFTRVCRSVDAQEAISLVIGPPGTGKSLICGLLVEQYKETHEVVVLGDTPIENRAAFLRHLLHHLGVNLSQGPETDLQLALVDRVCGPTSAEDGLLIVIDEAQAIAPEVLEAVRMVTNIMRRGVPRVSAVVCGGMKLDEVLIDSTLESFTQRVATRCYLHPMNAHETRYYIHEIITNCGADPADVIEDQAISAIHHAASGVARLVNQMMTQAIDTAEEAGESLITEKVIDKAWATLQQLPSPMIEEPSLRSSGGSSVEFGELELAPMKPLQKKSMQKSTGETSTASNPASQMSESPKDHEPLGFADEDSWDLAASEIAFESSEMWVDECDDPKQASTPMPSALFGDFEIEEEIDVRGSLKLTASTSNIPRKVDKVTPRAAEQVAAPSPKSVSREPVAENPVPRISLESMLHQEIVGLSSFDPTVEVLAEPDDDVPELKVALGDDDDQDCEDRWDDTPRMTHDDSDMLVIEDELELTRTDSSSSATAAPRSVTIDFQTMLSRMRTGT